MKKKREAEKPAENLRAKRAKKGAFTQEELRKFRDEIHIPKAKQILLKRKNDGDSEAKKRAKKPKNE